MTRKAPPSNVSQASRTGLRDVVGRRFNAPLRVYGAQFGRFAGGYKLAADRLVESFRGSSGHVVVFPICHLYHHCLELQIKSLVDLAHAILGEEMTLKRSHKIGDLWQQECRPLLERVLSPSSRANFDQVRECVSRFALFDPDGEFFRYPVDKERSPWEQPVESLDIYNMQREASMTLQLLDAFYSEMDSILECDGLAAP